MFIIRACEFNVVSGCFLNPSFIRSAWLLFSGFVATIILRFAHGGEMIPFMALVAFLTKCRDIFSFLMDSSQSTKLRFMLLARAQSLIESIAMLLFGFLLFSIKTGNIFSVALATPHVSHWPWDILHLTFFSQEWCQVPCFVDDFFNQLFVVNGLDCVLQDSHVKCGSKFAFLGFLTQSRLICTCGFTNMWPHFQK